MKCFTFSKTTTLGFFFSIILQISKKSVPLVSSKPFLCPDILKGWHGNPAVRTSNRGILEISIFLMSPKTSSPKLFL